MDPAKVRSTFNRILVTNKDTLWLFVFLSGVAAVGADVIRTYLEERHPEKEALRRLLDDFAFELFANNVKRNRLTVFRATSGWRAIANAVIRLLIETNFEGVKWLAIRRLRPRRKYLTVYLRPGGTRNQHSTTALRVADSQERCEGVAGLVWENGFYLVPDLPQIKPGDVKAVKSFTDLTPGDPIYEYALRTNLHGEYGLRVLKSMEHFATHFLGCVIRKKDGNAWGVLLLDSEEAACPFGSSPTGGKVGLKLADRAQVFAKLLES